MKKIIFVIVGLMIVGLVTKGVLKNIEDSKKVVRSISDIQEEQGIPVEVKPAEISNIKNSIIYSGTIKGREQADAVAKTQEIVEKILAKVGERVKKGDVVATLNRNNPGAGFQQIRLNLELAERELKRIKTLYDEGAISASELDRQENAYKLAKSNFESVNELLNVRATIEGVVTDIFIVEGQTVNPGQSVLRVSKFQDAELEIKVSENDIKYVSVGQKVIVRIFFNGNIVYEGKVDKVALSANPQDRSFNVWIAIPNKDMNLKPGIFATAELIIKENQNAIVVEKQALVNDDAGSFVFVVGENLISEKRSVKPGIVDGEKLEVIKGIKEGENIVIKGQNKLIGGEKVLIVN